MKLICGLPAGSVEAWRLSRFISSAMLLVGLGAMPPVGSCSALAWPGWIVPRPSAG